MTDIENNIIQKLNFLVVTFLLGHIIFGLFIVIIARCKKRKNKHKIYNYFAFILAIFTIVYIFIGCLIGLITMKLDFLKIYDFVIALPRSLRFLCFIYACIPYYKWIYIFLLNLDAFIILLDVRIIEGIYFWFIPTIILANLKLYIMLRYVDLLFKEKENSDNFFTVTRKVFKD